MIRSIWKKTCGLLIAMGILLAWMPFAAAAAGDVEDETAFLSEKGVRVGVSAGTVHEKLVKEMYPDAQIFYYDPFQGYMAVAQGKLDAYVYDKKQMELAVQNGQAGVRVLDATLGGPTRIALGLSKNSSIPDLENRVNAFIEELREDGTLDEMYERWGGEDNRTMPEIEEAPSPKYHLITGTTGTVEPYSYYSGNEITGYDIELLRRLAAWLDADLEIQTYDFASIIPAATSGRIDVIASNLQVTPERAEEMTFSEILYEEQNGVMVRDDRTARKQATGTGHWRDYDGRRIGVLTGTLMEGVARDNFPNSGYFYFDSYSDLGAALLAGKIDAFLTDEPNIKMMQHEQPGLTYIHDKITNQDVSFAFRKDDPKAKALCEEVSAFLEKIRGDGTLAEIDDIWMGNDEARKRVDMTGLSGENGTIRVVTTATDMPWSYVKDGENVGYDIDIVVRFCRERGYGLELSDVAFAGRIPSVQSGKCDFCTGMDVTAERREQVLFSAPIYNGGVVLVVPRDDLSGDAKAVQGAQEGFFSSVKASFQKTFIREGRYKLFIRGSLTTIAITLLSIVLGTALGFLLFMVCRRGNRAANALSGVFVWLVDGMPVVVLLMILYYIIFSKSQLSGTVVAVIAFGLVFGSGVFGMLKMGVGAVDKGQMEAALTLGYTEMGAFFRMILPQALPHILPAYKSGAVALIKATAIVGYIAVQDLTKMGDIVRGRTYDAFFPLIAVAVIYLTMETLITFVVGRIELRIDPKRRKREDILGGIVRTEAR